MVDLIFPSMVEVRGTENINKTINIIMMSEVITFKLSKEDRNFLSKEAFKERLTLSAYVRTKLLGGYEDKTV